MDRPSPSSSPRQQTSPLKPTLSTPPNQQTQTPPVPRARRKSKSPDVQSPSQIKAEATKNIRKTRAPVNGSAPTRTNRKPEAWMSPLWRAICKNDPHEVKHIIANSAYSAYLQPPSFAHFVVELAKYNKTRLELIKAQQAPDDFHSLDCLNADLAELVLMHKNQSQIGTGGRNALTFALEIGAGYEVIDALGNVNEGKHLINETDGTGETPLIAVVRRGSLAQVEQLVKLGANINAPSENGETPLIAVVHRQSLELVEQFVESGADVNAQSRTGVTAIYAACRAEELESNENDRKNSADIVNYLVSNGAKKDNFPHTAARIGDDDFFEVLLRHGEDVFKRNENGKTPFDLAKENRCKAIEDRLKTLSSQKLNLDRQLAQGWLEGVYSGKLSPDAITNFLDMRTIDEVLDLYSFFREMLRGNYESEKDQIMLEQVLGRLKRHVKSLTADAICELIISLTDRFTFTVNLFGKSLVEAIKADEALCDAVRERLAKFSDRVYLINRFNSWFE